MNKHQDWSVGGGGPLYTECDKSWPYVVNTRRGEGHGERPGWPTSRPIESLIYLNSFLHLPTILESWKSLLNIKVSSILYPQYVWKTIISTLDLLYWNSKKLWERRFRLAILKNRIQKRFLERFRLPRFLHSVISIDDFSWGMDEHGGEDSYDIGVKLCKRVVTIRLCFPSCGSPKFKNFETKFRPFNAMSMKDTQFPWGTRMIKVRSSLPLFLDYRLYFKQLETKTWHLTDFTTLKEHFGLIWWLSCHRDLKSFIHTLGDL